MQRAPLKLGNITVGGPAVQAALSGYCIDEVRVDAIADLLLVGLRNAHEHPDHAHGHLGPEIPYEIEPTGSDQGIEATATKLPDTRLERIHLARGEDAREKTPVSGMDGRVLEEKDSWRNRHTGADQFDDRPSPRDEGPVIRQAAAYILVTTQREEIVLLVVVERRFLAEAAKDGIRVCVDPDVVGVVVEITRGFGLRSGRQARLQKCGAAPHN